MTEYRCYLIDAVGAIRHAELIIAADDAHAVTVARRCLSEHSEFNGLELWQSRRRVHLEIREKV